MDWQTQPATEKQLDYLAVFGFITDKPLTKKEASELLTQFEENPLMEEIKLENFQKRDLQQMEEDEKNAAYVLHQIFDSAKEELEHAIHGEKTDALEEYKDALKNRIEFWKDTCRQADCTCEWEQAMNLNEKYGYRFKVPSTKQITPILEALDAKAPTWDKDYPYIFFETLEINFPELLW